MSTWSLSRPWSQAHHRRCHLQLGSDLILGSFFCQNIIDEEPDSIVELDELLMPGIFNGLNVISKPGIEGHQVEVADLGDYVERARRGEVSVIRRERPADRTGPVPEGRSPLPPGSKSYTFIYRDKVTDRVVARAHQPRYPSGKPIPGSENQDPIILYAGLLDKVGDKPPRHVQVERGHGDGKRRGPECWMWRDLAQREAPR